MKHQKLVCESLDQFIQESELNEGLIDTVKDWGSNIKNFVKATLKKVGEYYVAIKDGITVMATVPVNIGINFMKNKFGDKGMIGYVPSKNSISLVPGLSKFTPEKVLQEVRKRDKKAHIDFNKKYPTVEKWMADHSHLTYEYVQSKYKNVLNEDMDALKHYDPDVNPANTTRFRKKVADYFKHRERRRGSLFVWGAPGIGKTAIIEDVLKVSDQYSFLNFDAQGMTPDTWFMPYIERTKVEARGYKVGDRQYTELPKGNLPLYKPSKNKIYEERLKEDAAANDIANDGEGGIIFFDELTRCTEDIQSSCLSLLNDGKLGEWRLGSKWLVIGAGNRKTDDNAKYIHWSSTLGNRCSQINFEPTYAEWKEWAIAHGAHPKILRFLDHNWFKWFYTKRGSDNNQAIFASPRTWWKVSENMILKEMDLAEIGEKLTQVDAIDLIADEVGRGVALEAVKFIFITDKYPIEKIEKIWTNWKQAPQLRIGTEGERILATEVTAVIIFALDLMPKNSKLTVSQWMNFANWLVSINNTYAAGYGFRMLIEENSYMHKELGDADVDKSGNFIGIYKEGMDLIWKKYGDIWSGSSEVGVE